MNAASPGPGVTSGWVFGPYADLFNVKIKVLLTQHQQPSTSRFTEDTVPGSCTSRDVFTDFLSARWCSFTMTAIECELSFDDLHRESKSECVQSDLAVCPQSAFLWRAWHRHSSNSRLLMLVTTSVLVASLPDFRTYSKRTGPAISLKWSCLLQASEICVRFFKTSGTGRVPSLSPSIWKCFSAKSFKTDKDWAAGSVSADSPAACVLAHHWPSPNRGSTCRSVTTTQFHFKTHCTVETKLTACCASWSDWADCVILWRPGENVKRAVSPARFPPISFDTGPRFNGEGPFGKWSVTHEKLSDSALPIRSPRDVRGCLLDKTDVVGDSE